MELPTQPHHSLQASLNTPDNLFQLVPHLVARQDQSLMVQMLQASTQILEDLPILSLEKEKFGLMEILFLNEIQFLLAIQLDARLLLLLMDGMYHQLPLKFSDQI
jgi:hypothetical protein